MHAGSHVAGAKVQHDCQNPGRRTDLVGPHPALRHAGVQLLRQGHIADGRRAAQQGSVHVWLLVTDACRFIQMQGEIAGQHERSDRLLTPCEDNSWCCVCRTRT